MDRYTNMNQRRPDARQAATLEAIVTYRYLAPAVLAMEEGRQRALAEASQARLLDDASLPPRSSDVARRRWSWPPRLPQIRCRMTRPPSCQARRAPNLAEAEA